MNQRRLFARKSASLIAGAVKNMKDVQNATGFAVIDQVFPRGKASDARAELAASPPDPWHFTKQSKPIFDGLDEAIRNLQAGASRPVIENFVQVM